MKRALRVVCLGSVEVFMSSVVALLLQLLFTVKLEAGNRQKAMKRLRVPPLGGQVD